VNIFGAVVGFARRNPALAIAGVGVGGAVVLPLVLGRQKQDAAETPAAAAAGGGYSGSYGGGALGGLGGGVGLEADRLATQQNESTNLLLGELGALRGLLQEPSYQAQPIGVPLPPAPGAPLPAPAPAPSSPAPTPAPSDPWPGIRASLGSAWPNYTRYSSLADAQAFARRVIRDYSPGGALYGRGIAGNRYTIPAIPTAVLNIAEQRTLAAAAGGKLLAG
jgi:hypothetical protein